MSATKISRYESRLRVANLTPAANLRAGKLYVLAGEDDSYAASLLWSTLLSAAENGHPACLVSPPDISASLEQSGLQQQVQAALAVGKLSVLQAGSGDDTPLDGAARAQRMIGDLRHWKKSVRLLVINGAETLFVSFDETMLRLWRDWAERHDAIVVLMLREHEYGKALAALAPLAHMFAGIAQLKSRYGTTSLEIFHWFNSNGMIAPSAFPLQREADGSLHMAQLGDDAPQAAAPAADETQIIALKSAFLPKEKYPAGWRIVDDDLDLLHALAAGAVAATMIIPFTPFSDFDRIAHCVFSLRKLCGPRLKILIREVNSRLRYSQETLAVRMGANLIVPAEISYVRFLSLTSMVQGQVFPHSLPATYEQALKEAMPEQDQGYLPPAEFAQSVLTALAHSRVLHIQVALIRLPLAYGLLPLDALRYCKVKRAGDIYSSDENSVYVFLYACRENDIDPTLDRLFGLPVGELFSSDDRLLSARAIEEAMRDYEGRRTEGRFPDLSDELAGITEVQPQARKETLAAVPHAGPATIRYPAPPLAVQQPLTLRPSLLTDVSASVSLSQT